MSDKQKKLGEIKKKKKLNLNLFQKLDVKLYLIIIVFLLLINIFNLIIIFFGINYFSKEKKRWYSERFYFIDILNKKRQYTNTEKKEIFQKRIFGILKEYNTNLEVKEIEKYSALIYEYSKKYDIDPYIAISAAYVESKFNKNEIGSIGERGLYQFRPLTAEEISYKAKIEYYNGIEYDVLSATKLWFEYINLLKKRFNNNINYALLAYNCGASNVIKYSKLEVNDKTGIFDIDSGNLLNLKKIIYYNKGYKYAYNEKIYNFIKEIKTKINNKF